MTFLAALFYAVLAGGLCNSWYAFGFTFLGCMVVVFIRAYSDAVNSEPYQ